MLLQIPLCDRIGMDKDKGGIHHVACQRGDLMLHETLPILERTSSSVLVKVTNLLMKSPLFNLHPFNFELTLGMEEMEKSRIEEIKGFPENILIRSKRSFSVEDLWGQMERLRQVGKSGFVWLFCLVNHWKCVCVIGM